jgi:hypothetical protein
MTIIKANILTDGSGQPIDNATVYTQDNQGNATAVARSNSLGGFTAAVNENNPSVLVVAPGYAPKLVDIGDINDNGAVALSPIELSQGNATSVIPNTTVSAVPWWVWVAGAGIFLYATQDKKGKKISGDNSSYILPIGIVIAGYFILSKLGLFGQTAGDQNSDSITQSTLQATSDSLAAAAAAGDIATLSTSDAATIANSIYNAGVSDPVDQNSIQRLIIQANTLTDLLNIIQQFGTKKAGGTACSLFGNLLSSTCTTYSLPSFLRATLDSQHLGAVNGYFSSMNINYQF